MKDLICFILYSLILSLFLTQPVHAATGCDGVGNCYVYASATGSATGASWTNAYTGFGAGAGQVNPARMSRGVTYWTAARTCAPITSITPGPIFDPIGNPCLLFDSG